MGASQRESGVIRYQEMFWKHIQHCDNVGKTIEVRRSEALGDRGKSDTAAQLKRLFYTSTEDRNRAQIGLPPMPKPVPPTPPPSKERTQEILNDDRVKVRDLRTSQRLLTSSICVSDMINVTCA